ncbi:MAG: hypothetical protein ACK5CE_03755 [Actinomycetes bacterium]
MTLTPRDLLLPSPALRALGAQPEMDPLTELDALQEAQLLDVRFDTLTLTAGLLLELRMALQLREANTGVLWVRGVRQLSWSGPSRATEMTAWSVGSSVPRAEDGVFSLTLSMWPAPGAQLTLVGESAAFFAGDVPGLNEAPPDYGALDVESVREGLASWDSEFVPVHAVFLDPAESP